MGTSGINPKGLLFYVALVPQFVSADASLPVPVQSGLLGMTFVLLAGLVYTAVALLSRTLLQSRPATYRAAIGAADSALKVLPRFAVYNPLNTWGKKREMPDAPRQTFHAWYKQNRMKDSAR